MERKHGKDAKFKPWWKREVRRQVSRRHAGICERCGESCVHGLFERTQSRRAGISARNTPAFREKKLGRSFRLFCFLVTNKVYPPNSQNEQNLQFVQGGLETQVEGKPFGPGGHPQTPGNRRNADKEAGLPGKEDRARNCDSQEARHEEQEGYLYLFL